ncbi:DUF2945 domain-containing protein [Candidatus Saccharibacteria bacterium]|nr:DUF2945 domain-containing protein [Candidatus Saccharibacteria bacterium]
MNEFKKGDAVEWNTPQGTTKGKIVKKHTQPTKIKNHKVAASKDSPEYEVKSESTGNVAAHKPESLKKDS